MREIKFRGMDKHGKWMYGSYLMVGSEDYIYSHTCGDIDDINFGYYFEEVDCVGQYTNVNDCIGNEIYEGDIVHLEGMDDLPIIFENGKFVLGDSGKDLSYFIGEIYVVGNIYEDPEYAYGYIQSFTKALTLLKNMYNHKEDIKRLCKQVINEIQGDK